MRSGLLAGLLIVVAAQAVAADGSCPAPAAAAGSTTVVRPGAPAGVQVSVDCRPQLTSGSVNLAVTSPAASAAAASAPTAATSPDTAASGVTPLPVTAALWAAGLLALLAIGLALYGLAKANAPGGVGFSSHWGGFGGASGGWHLTSGAVALIGAAILLALAALLLLQLLQPAAGAKSTAATAKQ